MSRANPGPVGRVGREVLAYLVAREDVTVAGLAKGLDRQPKHIYATIQRLRGWGYVVSRQRGRWAAVHRITREGRAALRQCTAKPCLDLPPNATVLDVLDTLQREPGQSYADVVRDTGRPARTVRKALQWLVNHGYAERQNLRRQRVYHAIAGRAP